MPLKSKLQPVELPPLDDREDFAAALLKALLQAAEEAAREDTK